MPEQPAAAAAAAEPVVPAASPTLAASGATPAAAPAAAGPAAAAAAAPLPAAAAPAAAAAAPAGRGEPAKPGAAAPAAPQAPEKYSLAIPKGAEAFVDADDLAYVEEVSRNAGFTNEEAQAVLDEHVANVHATSERYRAQTMADPTYGGERLADTQRRVKLALDRLRPEGHARRDSFLRFLQKGGAGNHIEVVSILADLGALFDEAVVGGGSALPKPKQASDADVLFGGANSDK